MTWLVLSRGTELPAGNLTVKPLTSLAGLEWQATFSPDGSLFAYNHSTQGSLDIYVRPIAGGEPVRLTDNPADEVLPRWSPDGSRIAFLSDRGNGTNIYLVPALGGTERELAKVGIPWLERFGLVTAVFGSNPWSPDGKELVFARPQGSGDLALWKIHVENGRESQLTHPSSALDAQPTWSFDGDRIAFVRVAAGRFSLWVLERGEPRPLLDDGHRHTTPVWSADSRRVGFNTNRGAPSFWELELATGDLRQILSFALAFPVTGKTGALAYADSSHQVDIYWMERDGSSQERLTAYTRGNFWPRVAPDGGRVVYHSDRTGNWEIWRLDRLTGEERKLTEDDATDVMPDWSPDGEEIAFMSNRGGAFHVWTMKADGTAVRRVTEEAVQRVLANSGITSNNPRWSPDGRTIAYLSLGERGYALLQVPREGGPSRTLLEGVTFFDWYPDGRHVVYTRPAADGSGRRELVAINLESKKEIVLNVGAATEPVVSPTGDGVTYAHAASHMGQELYLLSLIPPGSATELPRPAGEPVRLTRGEGIWHVHNGGFSPDGRAVVFVRDEDRGDIQLIENYR